MIDISSKLRIKKIKMGSSAFFILLRYGTLFINAARGMYLASFLGPTTYGLYSLVILGYQQCSVLGLGLREGVTLKLSGVSPEKKYFAYVLSNILSFTFIVSMALIVLSLLSYLFRTNLEKIHPALYYLSIVFQMASISINCEILANTQRILGNVLVVAKTEIFYAISCFVSIIIISYFNLGLSLLFYFMLAINLLVLANYLSSILGIIKLLLIKKIILSLLQASTPLLVFNTLSILLLTIGQWVVGSYAKPVAIGVYSISASMAMVASNGMSSIAWAYFSEVIGKFSNTNNTAELREYLFKLRYYMELIFYLSALISGILFPLFFEIFFPEYVGADLILFPILLSLLFQSTIFGDTALLMGKKRVKSLIFSSLISCIMLLVFCLFVFNSNIVEKLELDELTVIALVVLFINIFYSIIIFFLSCFHLKSGFLTTLGMIFRLVLFSLMVVYFSQGDFLELFSIISIIVVAMVYKNDIKLAIASIRSQYMGYFTSNT